MPSKTDSPLTPKDAGYLRELFDNSARYYEWVNAVTSLGQVYVWRRQVVAAAGLRPDDRVLDAFCGPGGLSAKILPRLGAGGQLVLADLSPVMLQRAKVRLSRGRGGAGSTRPSIDYVVGDLLHDDLGLKDFDVVMLGWGLRYVEDVRFALERMRSFLRPRGHLVVLEFTRPPRVSWAAPVHHYFRHALPSIGSLLARDRELHDYLKASTAEFLSLPELVCTISEAGFHLNSCRTHFDGLVAILAATATGDDQASCPSAAGRQPVGK